MTIRLQVCCLASDPEFLLIYAVKDGLVSMPQLQAPFDYEQVRRAFERDATVHVTRDVVGRELRALLRERKHQSRSMQGHERKQLLLQEVRNELPKLAKADIDTLRAVSQEYLSLVQKRKEIEIALAAVTQAMSDARRRAASTGEFSTQYTAMDHRRTKLRLQMATLQEQMADAKCRREAARDACESTRQAAFIKAVSRVMPRDVYKQIWDEVNAVVEQSQNIEADVSKAR